MIRQANEKDLDRLMEIYHDAKKFMIQQNNPNQWDKGYPSRDLIREDIENNKMYLLEEDGILQGCFVYIIGPDSNYTEIEGAWLNDEVYGTIHRIASTRKGSGFGKKVMAWCFDQCPNLRVDTHEANKPMRHLLESNGFTYCGTIYVRDRSPRRAYQKIRRKEQE